MPLSPKLTNNLIVLLTLVAFALRLAYTLTSHPFIDEFTTVLAAQIILQRGLPILPSGLFYEHGILFTYLDAPFVALAGEPVSFVLARWPSLILGTLLVPLLYWLGRRWFSPGVGLAAALLLALSPEGMVWGGRARMYALAQLLVLVLVLLAYEGSLGCGNRRLRWLALLTLSAALLTQLAALLFVPPLLIGMLVVKWLSSDAGGQRRSLLAPSILPLSMPEWVGLGGVLGLGILVKRLGQPLGAPTLGSEGATNPLLELWKTTIAYQAGLVVSYQEAIKFLGRQFGVPHHLWLAIAASLGLFAFIVVAARRRGHMRRNLPYTFVWLIFGLTVVEMITLLQPFRRNPRYLVLGLPLFYLIVAGGLGQLAGGRGRGEQGSRGAREPAQPAQSKIQNLKSKIVNLLLLIFVFLVGRGLWNDLTIAYRTPEPAYEDAFQVVAAQQQPGDAVLTMNPSGAALYLDQIDYFAMQRGADQFLLNRGTDPIDRWLGAPWLGTAPELNRVLNDRPRTWFIIDTIRLPVYYRGDWQAILKTQMELVWANDEALVYRTAAGRLPLPSRPDSEVAANLGQQIQLLGYSGDTHPPGDETEGQHQLTLFWTSSAPLTVDYTVFVHVRDTNGVIVAQQDSQPLGGDYPTTQWQPHETIIDPHQIPLPAGLPAGEYQIWAGMYRLETSARLPVIGDTSGENAILLGNLTIK